MGTKKSPRSGNTFKHERENKDDSREKRRRKAAAIVLKQQKPEHSAVLRSPTSLPLGFPFQSVI